MKKRIHVNQHKIRSNSKSGDREPVITVKLIKIIPIATKSTLTVLARLSILQTNLSLVEPRFG